MKPRANEQLNPGHACHSSTFPTRRVDTASFGLDMLNKAACGCNAVETEDVSATKGEAVKRPIQQKVSKTASCTTTSTATKSQTERDFPKEHPQEFDLASMLFAPPKMTSSPPRRVKRHGGTRLARASQSCTHIGGSLPRIEETRPNPNKAGKRVSFKDDLVEMRKVHDVPTSENATAAAPITDERDPAAQHQDPTMTPEQDHHIRAESYQKNSADIGHANDKRGATNDILPITTFENATGGNEYQQKPRQPVTADAFETTWESSVGTQRPICSFEELLDESNVYRQKFDTCISDDTDDVDLIIDETSNREAHKDIKASDNTSVVDGVRELEQPNTQTTDTPADGQETLEASGRRKSIAMPGRQPFSESGRRSPASTCKTDKGDFKSKGLEILNPIIETDASDEIPPVDGPSTTADQLATSRTDIPRHTSKERYPSLYGSVPQSAQPRGAPNRASGEKLLEPSSIIINSAFTSKAGTNFTATKPTRTHVYSSHQATKAGNILTTGITTNRLLAPSYFQITKTTRIKGPSSGFTFNTNPSSLESKRQVPLLPNSTRAFLPRPVTRPMGPQQLRHQNSRSIPHPLQTTIVRNVQQVTLPLRSSTLGTVAYPGWQTNSKVIHILPKTTAVPIRPQPAPVHYIVYQNPVVATPPPPPPPPPTANQVGKPTQNAQVISQHAALTPTYYYQVAVDHKPLSQQRPSPSPQSLKDLSPPPPPPPPPPKTPSSKTEQKIQSNRPREIPGVASPRKQHTTPTKSQTRSTSSSIPYGTLFVQTPKGLVKLSKQIRLQTKPPSDHPVDARRNEDVATTSAIYKTNTRIPSCSPQTVKYLLALKKREKSSEDETSRFPNRETAKIHPPFYLTNKNESGQLGSADRKEATERKHLSSKTAASRVQREGRDSTLKYPDPPSFDKSQTIYEAFTPRGNVQKEVHTEANAKASSSRNESSNTTFRSKLDHSESLQFQPGVKSMHDFEGIGESSTGHSSVKNSSNDIHSVGSIFYESGKGDEKGTPDKLASLYSSPDERNSDETISYPKSSPSTCDEDGDKDESWLPPAHVKLSSKYIRRFRNPITGGLSKINIRTSESPRLRRKYNKWRKPKKTKNKRGLCKNEDREENAEVSKREEVTNTFFSLSPQENAKSDDLIAKYGGMSDYGINNSTERRADGCVPTTHRDIVEDSPPLSSPASSSASSLGDEASGMKNDQQSKLDRSMNKQGLGLQTNRSCQPTEISGSPSKRRHVRGSKSQSGDSDTISPRNSKTVKFDVSDIPINNADAKRNQIQIRQARMDARKGPNPAPLWQKVMKLLGIRRKPDKVSSPGGTPWHKRRSSSVVLAESLAESAKRLEDKAVENEDDNSGETSAADKNSPGITKEKESCKTTKENKKGKKSRKKRRKRRRLAKTKVSPESPDDHASSSLTSIDFDAKRRTRSRARRAHDSDSISSNAVDSSSPSSARRGRRTLASMSAQTWEDCYRSTYLKWKEASPSPENLATDELKVMTSELATLRAVPCKDRKNFQKLLMSKWENIVQTAQTGSVEQKYGTGCQDKGTKSEAIDFNLVDTPPVVVELDVSTTMQDSSLCSDPQDNGEENSLRCEETAEKKITPDVVKQFSDPTAATELNEIFPTPDEDATIATNDSDGYGSPPVLSPIRDISTDAPFDQLGNTDAQNSQGFIIPKLLTEDALEILAETGNIDPDLTGVQAYALFMPDMLLGDQYMSSSPSHNLDIADDDHEVPPVLSCHRLEYLSSLDDHQSTEDVGNFHDINREQILGPFLPSETTQNGLFPDDLSTENVKVQETVGQFVLQDYRNRVMDGLLGKGSASPNETGQEVEGLGIDQTMNSSTESLEEGEIVSD